MLKKHIVIILSITVFSIFIGCNESFNQEVARNINSEYSTSTTNYKTELSTEITTTQSITEPTEYVPAQSYSIDVEPVLQLPEFPTGCEITSLTTVLNHLGYDINKVDLYEDYFEKDLDGRITALKTNMSEVNRLKTDILNIINEKDIKMAFGAEH